MQCTFQNSPTMHDHKILKENTCISDLAILSNQRSCRVTENISNIFKARHTLIAYHSSADRYSAVCFDVRDDADKGNSAKLKFEGSRALTKAINF